MQSRWDPENLHRHSDYAPLKKEPVAQIKGEKFAGHDKIDVEASIDHSEIDLKKEEP